ncbi:ATP-binding cassette domain-containing protein [Methylorubrum populi]
MLPCVAVLRDGSGIGLLALSADGRFRVHTAAGKRDLSHGELDPIYSGTVVQAVHPPDVEPAPFPDVDPAERSLARRIAVSTLRSRLLPQLLLVAALGNLFVFALPFYSMAVYDRIIPHRAIETLWAMTGGVVIVLLVDFFCRRMRGRLQEAIGTATSLAIQQDLYQRLVQADLVHAQRRTGIVSSALAAIESASLAAPAILAGLLVDLPFAVGTLFYVAFIAQWVVAAPILTILAVAIMNAGSYLAGRRAHRATIRAHVQRSALLEESTRALEAVKTAGSERVAADRWAELADAVSYHGYVGRNASAFAALSANTLLQYSTVLSLVIGVFLINDGRMTAGALVASILLTSRVISPVASLAAGLTRALSLSESLRHAQTLARSPREQAGDARRPRTPVRGHIRLNTVTFRYPNEPKPALEHIDLTIRPGEKVGIIGRIGSGKSTLAHLIPRLYAPDSGHVLIDEHDVRQFDPHWLRRQITYMPQDCELFEATIRENIVRGLAEVDERLFEQAVHASTVKDLVATHPAGYSMEVGPYGRRMSGGERQAICLARALVRGAPVLVLDEPTSAMDSQFEARIVERLKPILADRTVIITSHRAPVLSLVDRLVWLEGGRVVADGPTREIMSQVAQRAA